MTRKITHEDILTELVKFEKRLSDLEKFVKQDHERLKALED